MGGVLRFEALTLSVTDLTAVTGAYPLDIDSDGLMDLAVLRRGADAMLRGLGDGRFEDASEQLGLHGGDDWTTAFSATWEGANALPHSHSVTTARSMRTPVPTVDWTPDLRWERLRRTDPADAGLLHVVDALQ